MNNKDLRELGYIYIAMEDGPKIHKNIFGSNSF